MGDALAGILFGDKTPWVLTLLVAAAGWTTVRTVDRLSSAPFLEYRIDTTSPRGTNGFVSVRIRNVTAKQRFDCFNLLVTTPDLQRSKFFGPADRYSQALHGTVLSLTKLSRVHEYEWDIQFTNIFPGADVTANIPVLQEGIPKLLVQPCAAQQTNKAKEEDKKADSDDDEAQKRSFDPPILVERTVETWFVENEVRVLWGALILWLITLVVLKALSTRATTGSSTPRSSECHDCKENGHDEGY